MSSKSFLCPIHREGYIFVVVGAIFSFLSGTVLEPVGWFSAIITLFIAYFFRDPERVTPANENAVISPADGIIQKIEKASPPEELEMGDKPLTRISVFLNVFNVHVNRVPIAGRITALHYRPGKFFNASLDKASVDNERQSCVVETKNKQKIVFVQIAGLVARRIVCDLELDQEVKSGERFGIIRFGSRADIYLPEGSSVNILEGQIVIGGETILAEVSGKKETKSIAKTTVKKVATAKKIVKKTK